MQPKNESRKAKMVFKYTLDKQARQTLSYLSKDSLRQAVKEDSKIFYVHKVPRK